jgi:hypothetical protein
MTSEVGRLEERITSLYAHMSAAMCEWLGLVGEFDALDGWASSGACSTAEWLAWRCSIRPVTAREHVRVARRLRELPQVREAFAAGQLSYSKVRAIARVEGEVDVERLLMYARYAQASELERIVAGYLAG